MEELIGATVIYNKNGLITQTLTADDITTSSTYPGSYCVNGINYGGSNNGFFVVYDYTQSSKFTQNGIYVVNTIQSIELTTSVLKTLDEKFIPDTIAKIENLNGLTTEEYVNTSIYNSTLVKSGTGDYSIMFYHIGSDGNVVASPAEASGDYSRAFGIGIASGEYSLIEGYNTYATASDVDKMINTNESAYSKGYCTHAEGYHTVAYGAISHSEGCSTKTIGAFSHAEGIGNIAQGDAQHVQGKYNIQDTDNKYAHIVGNGPSTYLRSNAHTLDWEGNAWYQGSVEATAIILKSPNGTRFNITIDDDGVLKADEITE